MFQHPNPFLQHAISHGQSLLSEINKTRILSQDIISACDNISMAVNSGNTQGAVNSIQNIRNMASQLSQTSQILTNAVNERLDMSSYVLSAIQHKLNEVSGALQSLRSVSTNHQSGWNQYGMPHYGFSQHQHSPFGTAAPQ